jgi:hypothetical protein
VPNLFTIIKKTTDLSQMFFCPVATDPWPKPGTDGNHGETEV